MTHPVFLVVLLCVLVTWAEAETGKTHQCSELKKSLVKFSIHSHRNKSGHWQSKIGLSSTGGTVNLNKPDTTWSLDVEQSTTTTCDEDEEMSIIATITQMPTVTVPKSDGPVKPIPADYELFPSVGYYKFHSESVNWARARQVCAEEGAHLAIINNENEADVLKQLFARFPVEKLTNYQQYNSIWVGVYEQGANGQYFTIFGKPLNTTGFQRWHPGRPAEPGSEECVVSIRTTAGLYDMACSQRATFVCELPA